jgi:hypothetical protein
LRGAEAYNNTNIDPDPVDLGKRAPCEDEQTDRKYDPSEASGVKPSFWTTLVIVSPEMNAEVRLRKGSI